MLLPCLALVLVFYSGQDCAVCSEADPAAVSAAKRNLEEAFALALTLPDCSGTSNLDSCRNFERLLSDAFDSLHGVVESHRVAETADCFSCDSRSEIAHGAVQLSRCSQEKGYADFAPPSPDEVTRDGERLLRALREGEKAERRKIELPLGRPMLRSSLRRRRLRRTGGAPADAVPGSDRPISHGPVGNGIPRSLAIQAGF
jgi:hypothetical protein